MSTLSNQFALKLAPSTPYNFTINWGDGSQEVYNQTTSSDPISAILLHTYAISGNYQIQITENISGGFPRIFFASSGDNEKVTDIVQWGSPSWSTMLEAFDGCNNLKSVASNLTGFNTLSGVKDFTEAWQNCTSLSSFPNINFANAINMSRAWQACTSLKTFPSINFPKVNTFGPGGFLPSAPTTGAWRNCTSMTDFPSISCPEAGSFGAAWAFCTSLTSFKTTLFPKASSLHSAWDSCTLLNNFPAISAPNVEDFRRAWRNCTNLTNFNFTSDLFSKMKNGADCFAGVTLPAETWSAILLSISANNPSTGVFFGGGNSTLTLTGGQAYNYLINRGWTIVDKGIGVPDYSNTGLFFSINTTDTAGGLGRRQFFIPLSADASYDFTVDWGDGIIESYTVSNTSQVMHEYALSGVYAVTVTPNTLTGFPALYVNQSGTRFKFIGVSLGTDASFLSSFKNAFAGCTKITTFKSPSVIYAENFDAAWANVTNLQQFPLIQFPNGKRFVGAWYACLYLSAFPPISFPQGEDFNVAWYRCASFNSFPIISLPKGVIFESTWRESSIRSFPAINFPSGTNFNYGWRDCTALRTFESTDFPAATTFIGTWNGSALTAFPIINCPEAQNFQEAWFDCGSLITFPSITFPKVTSFYQSWFSCAKLTDFPAIVAPSATNFFSTWANCTALTSFNHTEFIGPNGGLNGITQSWRNCTSLKTFPSINHPNGTFIIQAWENCSSLTDFPAINTPNVSGFQAAWKGCTSLVRFNHINYPRTTDFLASWQNCISLTDFPAISAPNATNFNSTWSGCVNLTGFNFHSNLFSRMTDGTDCFNGATLLTRTWSAILTSISAVNLSMGLTAVTGVPFHGGNSLVNAVGSAARQFLTRPVAQGGRGWTITDGGFDFPLLPAPSITNIPDYVIAGSTYTFIGTNNRPVGTEHIVTNWYWNMTGGNIANFTSQNVTYAYPTSGVFTISLTAQNANGFTTTTRTITAMGQQTRRDPNAYFVSLLLNFNP